MNQRRVRSHLVSVYPRGFIFGEHDPLCFVGKPTTIQPVCEDIASFKEVFQFHSSRRQQRRFLSLFFSMAPYSTKLVTLT